MKPEAVVAVDLDIGIRAFFRNWDFLLLQGRRLYTGIVYKITASA